MSPPYIALSYEWGEPDPDLDTIISVNGSNVNIGFSLQSFLCTVRRKYRRQTTETSPWYWADALCINQSDVDERNAQVAMMAGIYSSAQSVYAWLMDKDSTVGTTVEDFIKNNRTLFSLVSTEPAEARKLMKEQRSSDPKTCALLRLTLELCQSTYWSRRWIIQEILNAKTVVVCWGDSELPWNSLWRFLAAKSENTIRTAGLTIPQQRDLLPFCRDPATARQIASGFAQSMPMKLAIMERERHYHMWKSRNLPLLTALDAFQASLCRSPHDRLFALLSLVEERRHLRIDYALEFHELCWQVVIDLHVKTQDPCNLLKLHNLLCPSDKEKRCSGLQEAGSLEISLEMASISPLNMVLQVTIPIVQDEICPRITNFWFGIWYGCINTGISNNESATTCCGRCRGPVPVRQELHGVHPSSETLSLMSSVGISVRDVSEHNVSARDRNQPRYVGHRNLMWSVPNTVWLGLCEDGTALIADHQVSVGDRVCKGNYDFTDHYTVVRKDDNDSYKIVSLAISAEMAPGTLAVLSEIQQLCRPCSERHLKYFMSSSHESQQYTPEIPMHEPHRLLAYTTAQQYLALHHVSLSIDDIDTFHLYRDFMQSDPLHIAPDEQDCAASQWKMIESLLTDAMRHKDPWMADLEPRQL